MKREMRFSEPSQVNIRHFVDEEGFIRRLAHVTRREEDILRLICDGITTNEAHTLIGQLGR